jgi:hypothetical protein
VEKRTLVALALGLAAVACATGALEPGPRSTVRVEPRADGGSTVVLTGVVLDASRGANGAPAADALVEIDCTCIQGARAVKTDAEGRFRFDELPPGAYSARFVFGDDDRGYVAKVGPGERALFLINLDPNAEPFSRIIT